MRPLNRRQRALLLLLLTLAVLIAAMQYILNKPKKDKKTQIHDLVEIGRAKGKLTTQEIMDAMEDFAVVLEVSNGLMAA